MRKLILRCLALALPVSALANGWDVPNVAPRDLAMVSSGLADQVDAGATYVLPAALARMEGLSLSVGGSLLDLRTTWNDPTGSFAVSSSETGMKLAPPYSVFASYGFKLGDRAMGIGFGSNIPGGGNMFWQDSWPGRSRIITVDRKLYGLYGSAAIEVFKQLRLGGGVIYYRTTEFLEQGLDPTAGKAQLSTAGGQYSFDLSAEITPLLDVPLTIGVDYKHQAYQKLTGTAHFVVSQTLQPLLQDQNVTHILPYPSILNVGVAYKPIPALSVAFDFTFNRYQIYGEDLFQGDKPLPGPIVVPRNYGNGQTYRLGAEWMANPRLALRAGIERDISGMPKQTDPTTGALLSPTYSPTLPDSNTWAGAVGVGYSFARNLSVSAAVFYAQMDEVTATGTTAFPGRYDSRVWIYSLGVSYSWMPGEGVGSLRKF